MQWEHSLREVFNSLRYIVRGGLAWGIILMGGAASTTGDLVGRAFNGPGLQRRAAHAADAPKAGITLSVVKLPEAKAGFVLLPRPWLVERNSA